MSLSLNEHMYSVLFERQRNWFCVIKGHVRDVFVCLAHLAAKCNERLETQLIYFHDEAVSQSITAALKGNSQSFFFFFFPDCPKTPARRNKI